MTGESRLVFCAIDGTGSFRQGRGLWSKRCGREGAGRDREGTGRVYTGRSFHPLFFVSVASKGFSSTVSLLFATLAGEVISVASKELTQRK